MRSTSSCTWFPRPLRWWCRRCDGPAWRPRHLVNAAEVNVRQVHVERAQHRVRELVVALEAAAQPPTPRRDAAAGVQLERRFAAVEPRGDVVPGHLQQGGALQRGIATTAERCLQASSYLWGRQVRVCRGHYQRRAGHDAQDLRHALARLQHGNATSSKMAGIGQAVASGREPGVPFGSE